MHQLFSESNDSIIEGWIGSLQDVWRTAWIAPRAGASDWLPRARFLHHKILSQVQTREEGNACQKVGGFAPNTMKSTFAL